MVPVDEIAALRELIRERSPRLIAVDGMNGVGKSTRVAQRLGLPVVALDDFLPGDGRYLSGINIEHLRKAVAAHPAQVVVEGCCMLEVLSRATLVPDLHVYIRRLSRSGRWDDEEVGMGEDLVHQLRVLQEINGAASRIARKPRLRVSELHENLVRYHAKYQPHQRADLVLDLVEGG